MPAMMKRRWISVQTAAAGSFFGACLAVALCGCSPDATFHIQQPRLTGRQRDITLTSTSAAYGRAEDGRAWHILVRFPLPGAASGRPGYLVYLHVPEPTAGEAVSYPLGETAAARGFFFQRAGEGRGRELVISGFVRLEPQAPGRWFLRLLANGALGTQIQGTAVLRPDHLNVRDYVETRHPGDVADLLKPSATTRDTGK